MKKKKMKNYTKIQLTYMKKKKQFSLLITLFLKIYENKDLCNKLIEIFYRVNEEENTDKVIDLRKEVKSFNNIYSNARDILEENNYNIGLNLNNSLKSNNNNINPSTNNSITGNNNLRYDENVEINDGNINKDNLNDINIKIINDTDADKKAKIFKKWSNENIEQLSNDLCEQIISNLLLTEIKDKKKMLFKKKKEINASLNNSSASLLVSQNSMSIGSHSPGRNYP